MGVEVNVGYFDLSKFAFCFQAGMRSSTDLQTAAAALAGNLVFRSTNTNTTLIRH